MLCSQFSTWIPKRDEAPPLRCTNVSGITSPSGHGDSMYGSNSTGSLDSIGPVFTEQVTTTVAFFGITIFLFVNFTLNNSLSEDVLMKLIKAPTFSCLASGRLELST